MNTDEFNQAQALLDKPRFIRVDAEVDLNKLITLKDVMLSCGPRNSLESYIMKLDVNELIGDKETA